MISGENHTYWRITVLNELPEPGTRVWYCSDEVLAEAIYLAPFRWADPQGGEREMLPAYWMPVSMDPTASSAAPLPPGHNTNHSRPHHGQTILAYTLRPRPVVAVFHSTTRTWLDQRGTPVQSVRFWKTLGEFRRDMTARVALAAA
ncbi:MAG: hypothetical protein V4662_27635 [Verrucomicrobiota bacterium]